LEPILQDLGEVGCGHKLTFGQVAVLAHKIIHLAEHWFSHSKRLCNKLERSFEFVEGFDRAAAQGQEVIHRCGELVKFFGADRSLVPFNNFSLPNLWRKAFTTDPLDRYFLLNRQPHPVEYR
jgi:hypothetical protein